MCFLPVMMTDLFYMFDVLLGVSTEIVYIRGGMYKSYVCEGNGFSIRLGISRCLSKEVTSLCCYGAREPPFH